MDKYANDILKSDAIIYNTIDETSENGLELLSAVREASIDALGFFLKPSELFTNLAKKGNAKVLNEDDEEQIQSTFILQELDTVLKSIEKSTMGTDSQDDFDNLFYDIDLNSTKIGRTTKDRNDVIVKILTALDEIDFDLENTEGDVLGDAYEYLIAQFAAGAGQKAGEFYTPQQVSTILAKIVTTKKSKLKSVYDPTCGSGSLLLRVAREVKEVGHFYGQEQNRTTYNLARMNMILHDVNYHKFDIKHEDTLERPQHDGLKFEAIVANPPFSANWSANPLFSNDDRFSQYGRLAPKTKADFAFIQHMVHHLDDNGIMACIAPHGVLFRGGAEGHIRQYLIEDSNYVDAIIGLPANLFYGTSIPTCILVLKKCRETPENILFIDASNGFEKVKNQNVLLEEHIDKIISTYQSREVLDKYSNVATLEEIKTNDYNLNIPRYVNTYDEEESVNIDLVCDMLKSFSEKSVEIDERLRQICLEISVPFPDGNNLSGLNLYKKAIMQKIFTQELRFKDEFGKDYADWEEKSLGEILSIGSGKDYKHLNHGKVPVFGTGGFMTMVDKFLYDGETVCIGRKGTIDKPMYYHGKLWTVDTLFYTHSFKKVIPKFVFTLFQMTNWKEYNEASGVPSLSKSTIEKIVYNIPSLKEQTKIATFLSAIDEKIDLVNTQIEDTQEYKKGLLQQMFV